MKEIIVTFKTQQGEQAYQQVRAAGDKQSWKDKQIAKRVCRETIISDDPMVLQIKVKVPRIAIALELDNQVVAGLKKFGAEIDIDYTMEMRY